MPPDRVPRPPGAAVTSRDSRRRTHPAFRSVLQERPSRGGGSYRNIVVRNKVKDYLRDPIFSMSPCRTG